jgi:hypothetical protein
MLIVSANMNTGKQLARFALQSKLLQVVNFLGNQFLLTPFLSRLIRFCTAIYLKNGLLMWRLQSFQFRQQGKEFLNIVTANNIFCISKS